jgi:hypothetical protein
MGKIHLSGVWSESEGVGRMIWMIFRRKLGETKLPRPFLITVMIDCENFIQKINWFS